MPLDLLLTDKPQPRDNAGAYRVTQTMVAATSIGQQLIPENYNRVAFILSSDAAGVFRLGLRADGTAQDGILLSTEFPRITITLAEHGPLVWQRWVATTNTIANICVLAVELESPTEQLEEQSIAGGQFATRRVEPAPVREPSLQSSRSLAQRLAVAQFRERLVVQRDYLELWRRLCSGARRRLQG